jgi:hypothetical protein
MVFCGLVGRAGWCVVEAHSHGQLAATPVLCYSVAAVRLGIAFYVSCVELSCLMPAVCLASSAVVSVCVCVVFVYQQYDTGGGLLQQ